MVPANLPRCYNSSDSELNSTAWFAEYIGHFLQFLSLEDFQAFGSAQVKLGYLFCPHTQPACNLQPLFLLSSAVHPGVYSQPGEPRSAQPDHLTAQPYQLLHSAGIPAGQQLQPHLVSFHFHILTNMSFKHVKEGKVMTSVVCLRLFPCSLPLQYRCAAPGPAFKQLNMQETMMILYNHTTVCTDVDPQVHILPGPVPFTHAGIWVHLHPPLYRSQQLWRATSARTSMPVPLPPLATSAADCLQGSS